MPFTFTDFPGLLVYEPLIFEDERGYFFEAFNENIFRDAGITDQWVQDNQSSSFKGVIRGLHYQLPPHAQTKLVRVIRGKVLDVVIDLREGSPSYGKNYSLVLSAKNKKQLYIPKGFAHGFAVLSKKADLLYKCDTFYNKNSEKGIRYNDADLNIDWGLLPEETIISEKDILLGSFSETAGDFTC